MNTDPEVESIPSPNSPLQVKKDKDCKVKVAVRIRPFNSKELLENSKPYLIASQSTNQVEKKLSVFSKLDEIDSF